MNWLIARFLRTALKDEESESDWAMMLKVWGVLIVALTILLALAASAQPQVDEHWQPNAAAMERIYGRD